MHVDDLIFSMQCGEEIEFYINGNCYFLQPDYQSANHDGDSKKTIYPFTRLYDAENYDDPKMIFYGTAENIVNYVFEGKYTLKDHFNQFEFLW